MPLSISLGYGIGHGGSGVATTYTIEQVGNQFEITYVSADPADGDVLVPVLTIDSVAYPTTTYGDLRAIVAGTPEMLGTVSITFDGDVGDLTVDDVLTGNEGPVLYSGSAPTVVRTWESDDVDIGGATATTFTLTASEQGTDVEFLSKPGTGTELVSAAVSIPAGAGGTADTFTASDSTLLSAYTGESGYSWANMGSNNAASILSNALVPNSNTSSLWAYDTTAVATAQTLSADYLYIADSSNTSDGIDLGLLCRSGGYGVFVGYSIVNQYWQLFEVSSGETFGLLGTWADAGFDVAAQTRSVELRQIGTLASGIADWEVYVDGVLRISATNAEDHGTGGAAGIRHKGVSARTRNMSIDNFLWTGGS